MYIVCIDILDTSILLVSNYNGIRMGMHEYPTKLNKKKLKHKIRLNVVMYQMSKYYIKECMIETN